MSFLAQLQVAATGSSESVMPSVNAGTDISVPPGGHESEASATCNCSRHGNIVAATTTVEPQSRSEFDAFLYIVIVLCFYAMCIVMLMVKYIKRENEEAEWDKMFTDFVKREQYIKPYQQIDHRTDQMFEYVKERLRLFNLTHGISEEPAARGTLIYHETSV